MKAEGIDLARLLRFDQESGQIWLKSYRMVLWSACALGALRRELIQTLGFQAARGVMKRFGHAAGLADGLALAELFPDASQEQQLEFGPALHGLEGVANIVRDPERTEIDLASGRMHVEAYWEHSYEAEQHLELFGPSEEPVCWTLVGYATGHSTAAAHDRTLVVETECLAMGHERCRFIVDYARNLPEMTRREEPDYEKQHLPAVLQELLDRVKTQSLTLQAKEEEVHRLEDELARYRPVPGLLGESPAFLKALDTARTVAPVDTTVLILGESGTGKEGLARYVHDQSLRDGRPFVPVNCSALPETLQEAELFGYVEGAFTGASSTNIGLFEAAHQGTLFLDEIGDLSTAAQTKILRALQEGEIKRLGESRTRPVDVRIVAATHRDLKAMVREKTFREDLFYRLSVITIEMPPLRERGHDGLLLAEHFRETFASKLSREVVRISPAARAAIAAHPWPGNVRELRNVIERAIILTANDQIDLEDLPTELSSPIPPAAPPRPRSAAGSSESRRARLRSIEDEKTRIEAALEEAGGRRELAAQLLDLSRTTLWRRMKHHGLLDP